MLHMCSTFTRRVLACRHHFWCCFQPCQVRLLLCLFNRPVLGAIKLVHHTHTPIGQTRSIHVDINSITNGHDGVWIGQPGVLVAAQQEPCQLRVGLPGLGQQGAQLGQQDNQGPMVQQEHTQVVAAPHKSTSPQVLSLDAMIRAVDLWLDCCSTLATAA